MPHLSIEPSPAGLLSPKSSYLLFSKQSLMLNWHRIGCSSSLPYFFPSYINLILCYCNSFTIFYSSFKTMAIMLCMSAIWSHLPNNLILYTVIPLLFFLSNISKMPSAINLPTWLNYSIPPLSKMYIYSGQLVSSFYCPTPWIINVVLWQLF